MFTSRRYQLVSQQGGSDSDSDETTLFKAENGSSQKGEWQFGVRADDLNQDLDLPNHTVCPSSKVGPIKGYSRKQALFGACLFIVIVATVTALAVMFLIKQTSLPVEEPSETECVKPPKPLVGFVGTGQRPSDHPPPPPCGSRKTTNTPTPAQPTTSSPSDTVPDITSQAFPPDVTKHSPSRETETPSSGTTEPSPLVETKFSPSAETGITETGVQPTMTLSPAASPQSELTTSNSEATTPPIDASIKSTTLQLVGESQATPPTTPTDIDHSNLPITAAPTSVEYDQILHNWSNKISSEISPKADTTTQQMPLSESTSTVLSMDSVTTLPKLHHPFTSEASKGVDEEVGVSPTLGAHVVNWERDFFPAVSESTIELFDMNRDGVMDVVIVEDFSKCVVRIVAMDGRTGDKFWQKEVNFPAFAVRCELDVNVDGVMDCLVCGMGGGFAAIDGQDGSILWEVDPSIVFPPYNFYFPLIVKDLNNDGVNDIINMHGGDGKYKPEEHHRSPGYLVVVSGKTGQSLLPPMLTPDGHESYMSPVLFKLNGKDDFVLFGSGGETVPGSLWGVSLKSVSSQVSKYQASHNVEQYKPFVNDTYHPCLMKGTNFDKTRPTFDKKAYDFEWPILIASPNSVMRFCPFWKNVKPIWNKYGVCLYELVRAESKGVMLPPVMVDLNLDEIDDLVVSTFDGHTIAVDGSDATTRLWDAHYPETESYSVPTPLLYNNDSVPDLMIRTNLGEWNEYNSSTIRLLDGRNGMEIWSFDSAHSGMMSGVSVASSSPGSDAMLFMTIGTLDTNTDPSYAGGEYRVRRHGDNVAASDVSSPSDVGGEAEQLEDHHGNKDYVKRGIKNHDPPDLWISTPDDQFPDPKLDVDGFMRYCGESYDRLTAYLWLVTREMIESGVEIKPIAMHEPFIFILPEVSSPSNGSSNNTFPPDDGSPPGNFGPSRPLPDGQPPTTIVTGRDISKKHSETGGSDKGGLKSKKDIRCGHISAPVQVVATPAVGDFNSDGHLDVAYNVVWRSAFPGRRKTLPELKVFAFSLEDRYTQLMGEEVKGQDLVDFSSFLPADRQPWNRYMGYRGNNIYHRN